MLFDEGLISRSKKCRKRKRKTEKDLSSKRDMTHAISIKVSDIQTSGNSIVCYFP